jgi:hypothetical protein
VHAENRGAVGGVDAGHIDRSAATAPLGGHRLRPEFQAEAPLGEHLLGFDTAPHAPAGALGALLEVRARGRAEQRVGVAHGGRIVRLLFHLLEPQTRRPLRGRVGRRARARGEGEAEDRSDDDDDETWEELANASDEERKDEDRRVAGREEGRLRCTGHATPIARRDFTLEETRSELGRPRAPPDTISRVKIRRSSRTQVTLSWAGRGDVHAPLARTHPEDPPLERWSAPDGELLVGDNLAAMHALMREAPGAFTLAYLDPPFLTGRVHEAVDRASGAKGGARARREAFDDRWTDRAAYLSALGERLVLVRELLAAHGSVVVHVDPKTSHYVKVMMDEIFGEECFASEIVWRYRRWPSKTPNFQRVHDVLLRYRRNAATPPRWRQLYEPLAASTIATWGTAKQRAVFGADGRRERSSSTAEATAGTPMGDVWDIGVIAPVARERTGYPSQKPEALLERIVDALTVPGDAVLDPYAGSGTTLAVAARLGRRFVGIDQSDVAKETIRTRLARSGIAFDADDARTGAPREKPEEREKRAS